MCDAHGNQSEKRDHLQLLYDESAAKMAQSQLSNGDPAATMYTDNAFTEVVGTGAPPTDQCADTCSGLISVGTNTYSKIQKPTSIENSEEILCSAPTW